jgi:hypothetical protein
MPVSQVVLQQPPALLAVLKAAQPDNLVLLLLHLCPLAGRLQESAKSSR